MQLDKEANLTEAREGNSYERLEEAGNKVERKNLFPYCETGAL